MKVPSGHGAQVDDETKITGEGINKKKASYAFFMSDYFKRQLGLQVWTVSCSGFLLFILSQHFAANMEDKSANM